MAISFSGLASGMDTSSWVEALVSVKQAEITKLETKKTTIANAQETLNNIRNYFSSFQSLLENVTDARFGISSIDLFSQNIADSSNVSVLSAIATTAAENATYNIEVNHLATATEVNSGINKAVTNTVTTTATATSRLFDLSDDPAGNPIHEGNIVFEVDGFQRSVSVDESTTIADFIDKLSGIGIEASFDDNTGKFSMNVSAEALKSDTTGVMTNLHLVNVNRGYDTDRIDVITTITTPATATIDSKLKHFNIDNNSDCAFTITKNDGTVVSITTFTPESTLSDIFNVLENNFQIYHEVSDDGTITLTSDKFGNVFGGRLAQVLGFTTTEEPYISLSKMTSTDIVYSTKETLINRDSTLGQIGAVTSTTDRLIIKKQDGGTTVTTISSLTAASTVQDLFDTLAQHGITATLDNGIISLTSTTGNFIDGAIATNIGILHPVTDTHSTTAPVTMTSSENINTSYSMGALGMDNDGSVVIYSPVYGIVSVNINKELSVQGFCDKINDSNYGIKAEIVGNKVKISELAGSGSYIKSMSTSIQNALKMSVGEGHSYNSTTINVYSNTNSGYIAYNDTAVELNANTKISEINGYSNGDGKIRLHMNGEISTITVDSTLTIDEFMNNPIVGLAQYGITGQVLSDGKAYLTADADIYLEAISGGSNILSALKLSGLSQTTSGQHAVETARLSSTVRVTTTVAATNSTELASLNYETIKDGKTQTVWFDSLYKYETVIEGTTQTVTQDSTLVFKVNDYYKTVTLKQDDTFGSLINKLSDVGINAYITRGKFYIASGYDNVEYLASESTSNLMEDFIHLSTPKDLGGYCASSEPVKSKVITTTQEKMSAVNYADMNTKLSTVSISSGTLTVYRDGQRANIIIDEDDTFGMLQSKLTDAFGDLRIDFDENNFLKDGKLRIYARNNDGTVNQDVNISIGSTSDKTNFVAITGIAKNDENVLESSRLLYKMNEKTSLDETGLFRNLGLNEKVTAGSFKIGDADIYITKDENNKITTTIADIVSQINSSERSLATAYWDSIDGKLVIRSTVTGASAVNIEAGDTNFTELLGLTNNGNLVTDSQKIGSNAVVTINGTKYTSLSNNVTSDSTGLTGLTLNLKGLSNGSTVTLTVKRDTESLVNAITNILDRYNELISNIDTAIAKGGNLSDQSMLKLLRNNIRTAMNSSDPGTTRFRNLASIGIKASAESNASSISTDNKDITFLSLDKDAFMDAFENYEDDVRALLIGSKDADGNVVNEGILSKVESLVENALAATNGYFSSATKSFNSDMDSVSQKIVKGNLAIEKYRKRLENKFSSMDIMIAGLQNQYKSFLS